jgi:hypothetical protein
MDVTITSMPARSDLLESLGRERVACGKPAAFYARVGKNPVLHPLCRGGGRLITKFASPSHLIGGNGVSKKNAEVETSCGDEKMV